MQNQRYGYYAELYRKASLFAKQTYIILFSGKNSPEPIQPQSEIENVLAYCWLWLLEKGLISETASGYDVCKAISRHTPADFRKARCGDNIVYESLSAHYNRLYDDRAKRPEVEKIVMCVRKCISELTGKNM